MKRAQAFTDLWRQRGSEACDPLVPAIGEATKWARALRQEHDLSEGAI